MNERIKELAEQADIKFSAHWQHQGIDTAVIIPSDLKKFAELIVKECAKAAGDFEYARLHDSLVEDHVLKHFGIEE